MFVYQYINGSYFLLNKRTVIRHIFLYGFDYCNWLLKKETKSLFFQVWITNCPLNQCYCADNSQNIHRLITHFIDYRSPEVSCLFQWLAL